MPDSYVPTILIVDDEEMVLTALRSFLQLETSYRVLCHTSPQAALDIIANDTVDVIIADFMMPAMDGIEFLKRARDLRPHASRILLTGYADVQNAIRAINEVGLYHYLEKPWDNDRLILVIRNGVERSTLVNELDSRLTALEAANVELFEMRRRLIKAFL
jgi:DNA-binding NtrC family response regulator